MTIFHARCFLLFHPGSVHRVQEEVQAEVDTAEVDHSPAGQPGHRVADAAVHAGHLPGHTDHRQGHVYQAGQLRINDQGISSSPRANLL